MQEIILVIVIRIYVQSISMYNLTYYISRSLSINKDLLYSKIFLSEEFEGEKLFVNNVNSIERVKTSCPAPMHVGAGCQPRGTDTWRITRAYTYIHASPLFVHVHHTFTTSISIYCIAPPVAIFSSFVYRIASPCRETRNIDSSSLSR